MVAKCLQNLANLIEFGGKEPYMEVVNPFILKNKERMVVYLDHLSVSMRCCPLGHLLPDSILKCFIFSRTIRKNHHQMKNSLKEIWLETWARFIIYAFYI